VKEQQSQSGPLRDKRVLDLAEGAAGFCSKLLADFGADVIKIEKPGGDQTRCFGPFWKDQNDPEKSLFFWYHNTNKRSITLDMESETGRDIFRRLIKGTDVLVESCAPSRREAFGLDFDTLKEHNPRLTMVSITGFGVKGPHKDYKSCDLVAAAYGGQMSVTGSPAGPPLKACGHQSWYTASLYGAIGVMLALKMRALSGKGSHLDISLQDVVASTLDHVMVRYFDEKVVAQRVGSRHWNHAFYVLPCRDGHILLSPFLQWDVLIEWLSSEGMAGDLKDEKYNDPEYRLEQVDHVIETFAEWTQTYTRRELFEAGQLRRFPWAPICSPKEVTESPQLTTRGFFSQVFHSGIEGGLSFPGTPYQSSLGQPTAPKPAPAIGENNVEIYQRELGLADEELEALRSRQVI